MLLQKYCDFVLIGCPSSKASIVIQLRKDEVNQQQKGKISATAGAALNLKMGREEGFFDGE